MSTRSKPGSIEHEVVLHGRRNNQAWFEPAMGVIPGKNGTLPQVFIRATLLTGNDIGPQLFVRTDDLGKTWSDPVLCQNWRKEPMGDDVFEEPWFGLHYHARTNQLLALGQTHFVQDAGTGDAGTDTQYKRERHVRAPNLKGAIVYSTWEPDKKTFAPWARMIVPEPLELGIYYNGQRHEQDDGTMLVPGYYRGPLNEAETGEHTRVTVLQCDFNGPELKYLTHGSVHAVEDGRGLAEPSLIHLKDRYFMTIRHDLRAYVTTSTDGLHFGALEPWRFDDGEELGNSNTQQHWLKHDDALFLVYNRKSDLNHGVFRNRAPLYLAQVDTRNLRVNRASERIVFPENGARMGNFCMADVSPDESWIVSGEWLEGLFPWSRKGTRFWIDHPSVNYIQYVGNLLLARVHW